MVGGRRGRGSNKEGNEAVLKRCCVERWVFILHRRRGFHSFRFIVFWLLIFGEQRVRGPIWKPKKLDLW